MTVLDFFNLIEKHDFYYSYSDDHNVWSKGVRESMEIKKLLVSNHPEFTEVYNDYVTEKFNGEVYTFNGRTFDAP